MKIAALNGSPRGESANSRQIISLVQSFLPGTDWIIVAPCLKQAGYVDGQLGELFAADVLLIAFPLYVDGIPASFLHVLERYSEGYRLWRNGSGRGLPVQRVFAVANCGFHEGVQNRNALEQIALFCAGSGLDWCGGAGIGTGEMLRTMSSIPPEAGIRKPVTEALRSVAEAIRASPDDRLTGDIFTQHDIPWFLYKLAGERGWLAKAKKNGVTRRDLDARPLDG
jgi:hypothetical protein